VAVTLSIKNVPEGVLLQLRAQAQRNHRSLQGELMAILEAALAQRRLSPAEVHERVTAIGLRTPTESATIVRELRDAR
jgi:antitoxin FitA